MPYAPIDVGFDDDPKYANLSAGHMGLLACAITYSNRNLTDGVIPASWPHRRFGASGSQLSRSLIALGVLSVRSNGDLQVVGYLKHNRSKEWILAKRAKKRIAGQAGGLASAASRAQANAEANIKHGGCPPANPDPDPIKKEPPTPFLISEAPSPRPSIGALPQNVIRLESPAWVAAYERVVTAERGGEPWSFPMKTFSALLGVIQTHCRGQDRLDIQRWLEIDLRAFLGAVRALGDEPGRWSNFSPDGLQAWHNRERPGLAKRDPPSGVRIARAPIEPLAPPPMTPSETLAEAQKVIDLLNGKADHG